MKNFNQKKTIAERGGLMIEALAMLGLIAVVTPTMYKKSAERTMEVEDINTATTIRTIMSAAEAYMASNYTDIMRVMEEESHQHQDGDQTIGVLDVPEEDLLPYLPYKYSANNALYNYKTPTVRIVRSGDNLTAFALFPAKVADGVGQERTVRIASLIGSNGGYVSKENSEITAHGVGGIWNLNKDQYEKVFQKEDNTGAMDANTYSIMVSSADVVNSSSGNGGGGDHPEFLLRYKKAGEEWRNAMRTDLYMGQGPDAENDGSMVSDSLSSIRNINSLIVGTTGDGEEAVQNLQEFGENGGAVSGRELDAENYGLYIIGSGNDGTKAGNAYITGTLLAAGNKLWASKSDLHYTGTNLTFDGTNFKLGKYVDNNNVDKYIAEGNVGDGDGGNSLNIIDNLIQVNDKGGLGNYKKDGKGTAKVAINTGTVEGNKVNGIEPPKYATDIEDDPQPDFGVDVADNMVVEGVLAAGQLDVNKIRTSNISVGSTNINDKYKWMDVDDKGVHIHDPAELDNKKVKRQLEVDDDGIVLRSSETAQVAYKEQNNAVTADHGYTAAEVEMFLDSDGFIVKTEGKLIELDNSELGIQISKHESGSTNTRSINIGNATLTQNKHEITQSGGSGENYNLNVNPGAEFNIHSGNLRVENGGVPVLSVRGKNATTDGQGMAGMLLNGPDNNGVEYDVAARGNAVFADSGNNARYLSMSDGPDHSAAVNITRGDGDVHSSTSKGIIYVDMDQRDGSAHFDAASGDKYMVHAYNNTVDNNGRIVRAPVKDSQNADFEREVQAGSIYIRKGLIDIVPDASQVGNGYNTVNGTTDALQTDSGYVHNAYDASDGRGVIRASRFVANNVDNAGNPIKVPDFYGSGRASSTYNDNGHTYANSNAYADFGNTVFEAFNGEDRNRYDTYMVNPAYTSVMNDIKLVSRGGARLSDILPTFITKGIYTAVNNSVEQQFRSGGTGNKGGVEIKCTKGSDGNCAEWPLYLTDNCPSGVTTCLNIAKDVNMNNLGYDEPASPFIGIIPTPQCPPGYIRVIQITPASIRMAEAGSLKGTNSGYDPRVSSPEQRFGGLSLNVNDYANPSNSVNDVTQVSHLGDHLLAKNIYDVYMGSYGGTTSDGVRITDPQKYDVQSSGALDFKMSENPQSTSVSSGYRCVEREIPNDPNSNCIKYAQFYPKKNYQKNAEGGELMEINLATIKEGVRSNVEDHKTFKDGVYSSNYERTNKFSANYRNYNDPSDSRPDVGAEAISGVWRDGNALNGNDGNIVNHDVNIKLPGIMYAITSDGKMSIEGWKMDDHTLSNLKTTEYKVNEQIDLSGTKLVVDSIKNVHITESGDDKNENVYVLTSKHKGLKPLTFQKSTWMKVEAVQLPWESDLNKRHPYIAGWAVLMGFIYPETGYGNILKELGMDNQETGTAYDGIYHTETGGLLEGSIANPSEEVNVQKFYWNVFPVARSSLEAYITTYCYFEESDYGENYNVDDNGFPMVDRVNTFTKGYKIEDGANKRYREKLNDPSMKYNELW